MFWHWWLQWIYWIIISQVGLTFICLEQVGQFLRRLQCMQWNLVSVWQLLNVVETRAGMHNFFEAKGQKLEASRAKSGAWVFWRGSSKSHQLLVGLGERCKLRKHILVYFELEKSQLVATFSITYFSSKSGNGALWSILTYAGVPNNWKPKVPDFGMNWNRTIRSCHNFFKCAPETSNGPIFKKYCGKSRGPQTRLQRAICCAPQN